MKKVYVGTLQNIFSELIEDEVLFVILIVQFLLVQVAAIFMLFNNRSWMENTHAQPDSKMDFVPQQNSKIRKYSNSGLTTHLARDLKSKLERLMDSEKTFRYPDLKLTDLAAEMGVSPHITSQLINQEFGKDFNSYINTYRIKEAISIFRMGKYGSISEVFFYVGFNNKTTFNRAFKNYTKKTPSEFINDLNSQDSLLWKI